MPNEPKPYNGLAGFEEYIVMIEDAEKPTCLYYGGNGDWCDMNENFYRIISWMPLPEPYKPEK